VIKSIPVCAFSIRANQSEDYIRNFLLVWSSKVEQIRSTADPRVKIGTVIDSEKTVLLIQVDSAYLGYVMIVKPSSDSTIPYDIWSKLRGSTVFVPHSGTLPSLRGKGYVSSIYTSYLDRGASFIASTHTQDAANLWDKLSSKYRLAFLDNIDGKLRLVSSTRASPKAVKILLGRNANI
jgi:hypothetical protein